MAQKLNHFLTRGCDLLLLPFAKLPPFWGILFLSLLTSLFVLAVYRAISSPRRVKETKNRIKANILAIRLYRDFWQTIVSSFFKSLFYTGKYFVLNLLPLLVVLPLMFLLFVQMDIRYGMRPFRPGESITVKASFAGAIGAAEAVIAPTAGFQAVMNPVYIDALREVDWKLRALQNGKTRHRRSASTASRSARTWSSATAFRPSPTKKWPPPRWRISSTRLKSCWRRATPLKSISIQYPARSISLPGLRDPLAGLLPGPDHDHRPGAEESLRSGILGPVPRP